MKRRFADRFAPLTVFVLLTLAAAPYLQCNNVTVALPPTPPIPLRQMARVKITYDGKPVPGAQIAVWGSAGNVASPVADENGLTTLPKLPSGVYFIGLWSASHVPYSGSLSICIVPCADSALETTTFVNESLDGPTRPISRDQLALNELRLELGPVSDFSSTQIEASLAFIHRAEQQPPVGRFPALLGVVQDPTGAVVPGALVEVARKGSEEKPAAVLRADRTGQFSADLPDGEYVALVSSPGFQVRAVAFTIDRSASASELRIQLDIGATTQVVTIARSR